MEIDKSSLAYIESYIRGELDEKARVLFNERLQSDDEFREQYEFISATVSFIEERNKEDLRRKMGELEKEYEKPVSTNERSILRLRWLQIAAALALIISAYFLLRPDESISELQVVSFEHLPSNQSTYRSTSDEIVKSSFEKAYGLYEIKSYDKAAPLLLNLYRTENDTMSLLYAGIAFLGDNNIEMAKACLEDEALSSYSNYTKRYLDMVQTK